MTILLNHWHVNVSENTLKNTKSDEHFKIEPRTMAVLALLIEHQNHVVSRQEFVDKIWGGRATVEESLTRCISELRKVLEEDVKNPAYIKTVHKKGYKLLVDVHYPNSSQPPVPNSNHKDKNLSKKVLVACIILTTLVLISFVLSGLSNNKKDSLAKSSDLVLTKLTDVRTTLLDGIPLNRKVIWENTENNAQYTIDASEILDPETGQTYLFVKLTDQYKNLLWQSSHTTVKLHSQSVAVEAILEVLRLLQVYKTAPELALLPNDLRSHYRRAKYLIDLRGQDNLEDAIKLLDKVLAQRHDFVMALVQKATAVRMLAFYLPEKEQREQRNLQYSLLLKQANALAPEHPVIKSFSHRIDFDKRNWIEHEYRLKEAVEYSPACIICVRNLAEYYLNMGFYKQAEALVENHLAYFPLSMMMNTFLGQIYNMQGFDDAARHQIRVINALGSSDGSDALAIEINVEMNAGNLARYQVLADKMIKKYPTYETNRYAIAAQIEDDIDTLIEVADSMPRLDFNIGVSAGKFPELIARINKNVYAGNLRDIRLIHGWLNADTHISKYYRTGLLNLKNQPEVIQLFNDIGLFDYWRENNRWPDYCEFENHIEHRPNYCPQ